MAFIDTLKRTGVTYDFTARKIYPLFSDLGLSLSDPATRVQNLKQIIRANYLYCLRGDPSVYRDLLAQNGATEENLDAFIRKFAPFFVEDFSWTEVGGALASGTNALLFVSGA
jgi:hypothetical protein